MPRELTIIDERGVDGWWVATLPEIPGAFSPGRTKNVCVKADDKPSHDPERDQDGSVKPRTSRSDVLGEGAVLAVETAPLPDGRGSDRTSHTRS